MKKKSCTPLLRRINNWLHLWLGLFSGIIVFIVSITGCIYSFEKEIRSVTQPYQFVKEQKTSYLPPTQLRAQAEQYQFGPKAGTPGNSITGLQYPGPGKAAIATYRDKVQGYTMLYMNPYSGQLLKVKALEKDFFRIVLMGHFSLWLPRAIGQQVVCWSVLVFIILLITGMVMWWPKNLKKANKEKSFMIKWKASFKRVNYDLHNVLGFYTCLGALIIAITGIYYGFKWVPKSIYWVASGGKTLPDIRPKLKSDSTVMFDVNSMKGAISKEDSLWYNLNKEYGNEGSLQMQFPIAKGDVITVNYNSKEGTFYKNHTRYFDRYTLKELKRNYIYNKPYEEGNLSDKVIRMNYDIHIGSIGGITGKILAFLISLVCASLPVTGFIVWWGKRKKAKRT